MNKWVCWLGWILVEQCELVSRVEGRSSGRGSHRGKKKMRFFDPWVRKIPCRRKWQSTPVFLPGEYHGQRSLVGYILWSYKELGTTEWLTQLQLGLQWFLVAFTEGCETKTRKWKWKSMEFSRSEYWSGQPFPSPGDLPNPGIKPRSPTLQEDSLPAEPPGKPKITGVGSLFLLQLIFPTQESNQGLLRCRWIFTNWAIREAKPNQTKPKQMKQNQKWIVKW